MPQSARNEGMEEEKEEDEENHVMRTAWSSSFPEIMDQRLDMSIPVDGPVLSWTQPMTW
jgi:hypothetical protein